MDSNMNDMLGRILESFEKISYVKTEDIPNIDLYMDQVTTFMDKRLRGLSRNPEEDKIMTKTMINNYAKNDLLPSPVKKKYSKEHVIVLLFIYYFKSFLSIGEIQTIIKPLTDNYFDGSNDSLSIEDIYNEVVALEKSQIDEIKEDVLRQYNASMGSFDNIPEENREFLKKFSLICSLGFDLYLKQSIIQKLIDDMNN